MAGIYGAFDYYPENSISIYNATEKPDDDGEYLYS